MRAKRKLLAKKKVKKAKGFASHSVGICTTQLLLKVPLWNPTYFVRRNILKGKEEVSPTFQYRVIALWLCLLVSCGLWYAPLSWDRVFVKAATLHLKWRKNTLRSYFIMHFPTMIFSRTCPVPRSLKCCRFVHTCNTILREYDGFHVGKSST